MTKIKDKERILKALREKKQVIYKRTPIRPSTDFSAETLQARREWHNTFRVIKGKTYNQEYSNWQGSHSDLMERSKVLQTSKLRVQHHQASFMRNVKGTSLGEKEKTTTRNIKIMKGRNSSVKANIQ